MNHGRTSNKSRKSRPLTNVGGQRLKGPTAVSLIVVLLIGLALGSALTYEFKPQTTVTKTTEGNGATYSTITLTALPLYHWFGALTCETVSETTVTTYVILAGTVGLTTMSYAPPTATVYVVTVTTEGAQSTFYTQGSTPTC